MEGTESIVQQEPIFDREALQETVDKFNEVAQVWDLQLCLKYLNLDGNHEITVNYKALKTTVDALMDYARILELLCDQWNLEGFHRAMYEVRAKELRKTAEKFQAGIGYDYAVALEKCRKKKERQVGKDDVGDDGLTQLVRRTQRENEKQKKAEEN